MKGFNDELNGTTSIISKNNKENIAYDLGALHALFGDDVSSIDFMANENILEEINNLAE